MTILLANFMGPARRWADPIQAALPNEKLFMDLKKADLSLVDIVLMSHGEPGIFSRLPNLKLIITLQAGVDGLLKTPDLPSHVPIVRSSPPQGDPMIMEYVLLHVLRHHREMPFFIENQRQLVWEKPEIYQACDRCVGFMGLGLMAYKCAEILRDIGFQVACWTRTKKTREGIKSFIGEDELKPFLRQTDILINILPLTPATADILCMQTLSLLPSGASVINIGRGQHIVDQDLIDLLDSDHLAGATLDVFRQEPLDTDHPFWKHPKITLMPHTARKTRPIDIVPQIKENVLRLRGDQPLLQVIDTRAGY
ncbi:MAG: glyoxylate/hydroxypyruvate reductase A [Rhodospirillaceae bacterium]|nr:glyoxylate/hydroxypyruvate reductase A [Rhodospirillaceae bacterium]